MVMIATMPNIEFVRFSKLYNWSVQYLQEDNFSYNQDFPLVTIGTFLKRNKTIVEVKNGVKYKRVTIKTNNGGVFLRDTEIGEKIGTKNQFVIKEGQFLVSKIDARNGAFGVVTNEVDGAIITGNFWAFDLDYSLINPHYLALITTTPEFIKFCENSSTGTTNRHYLQEDLFLAVEIPLPPVNDEDAKKRNLPNAVTQEKLVAAYNQKIAEAEAAKIKAKEKEADIENYLLSVLGISKKKKQVNSSGLAFVKFSIIERWDALSLMGSSNIAKSEHSNIKLSKVIKAFNNDLNGSSLRFETYKFGSQDFYYLGMENVERDSGKVIELPTVKGNHIKSQTIKVPSDFLIYGKLRPYLNKYWHNTSTFDNIVCSSEFFVFDIDTSIVDKSYFVSVLSSSIIQNQIKDKFSGVRMPRISSSDFFDLQIPLPTDLNLQKNIANNINLMRAEIARLLSSNIHIQEQALLDFEYQIFKRN